MPTFEIVQGGSLKTQPARHLYASTAWSPVRSTPETASRCAARKSKPGFLMDPDRTYYQVLQSKLKWGGA